MSTAAELVSRLCLAAHPEGGWFREVHRSAQQVATPRGARAALTSIYYLLEAGQASRWHVVESDEIWHFHDGAPLELLVYSPRSGVLRRQELGAASTQHESIGTVRAGEWQAARSLGAWSLMGCDVAPGFDFADFRFVAALEGHAAHFRGALAEHAALL